MSNITFNEGTYKFRGENVSVAGMTFPLVTSFKKANKNGGYVTVDGTGNYPFPERNIKIRCVAEDSYTPATAEFTVQETDEQTIERMRKRFDMLEDMTKAVKKGAVRAMIVSGPPGVGKSHGVEKVLDRYQMVETLGGQKKYEVVKGAMSAIGLYCKLYKYQEKDNVLVFDDCDSVFSDELSLNILKAALDSKANRTIHWNTDSHKLRNEGVPDQFTFKGSAIFITNLKLDKARGKLKDHLAALESRCHYVDLTIDTDREKMLRIEQITKDGMLDDYRLGKEVDEAIVDFVRTNKDRVRELSLRTVLKIADLASAFPDNWEAMAENTVMRRAGLRK